MGEGGVGGGRGGRGRRRGEGGAATTCGQTGGGEDEEKHEEEAAGKGREGWMRTRRILGMSTGLLASLDVFGRERSLVAIGNADDALQRCCRLLSDG
eukprot:6151590-Pyramimonas_sp.AAC.1